MPVNMKVERVRRYRSRYLQTLVGWVWAANARGKATDGVKGSKKGRNVDNREHTDSKTRVKRKAKVEQA